MMLRKILEIFFGVHCPIIIMISNTLNIEMFLGQASPKSWVKSSWTVKKSLWNNTSTKRKIVKKNVKIPVLVSFSSLSRTCSCLWWDSPIGQLELPEKLRVSAPQTREGWSACRMRTSAWQQQSLGMWSEIKNACKSMLGGMKGLKQNITRKTNLNKKSWIICDSGGPWGLTSDFR